MREEDASPRFRSALASALIEAIQELGCSDPEGLWCIGSGALRPKSWCSTCELRNAIDAALKLPASSESR